MKDTHEHSLMEGRMKFKTVVGVIAVIALLSITMVVCQDSPGKHVSATEVFGYDADGQQIAHSTFAVPVLVPLQLDVYVTAPVVKLMVFPPASEEASREYVMPVVFVAVAA